AAQRANKAVVFDEDGNVTVSQDDYVDQAANAAASAAAAALAEQGAQTAAAAAFNGAELAEAWATKTDGPVADGEYSAKHYAQQAQTNAGLPVYQSIPTSDVGPIYAVGIGPMEWNNDTGSYVRMSAAADLVNHVVKHCAAANIPELDEGPLVVLDGDMPGLWIWNGAVYVPKTLPARSRRGGTLTPSGTSVSIESGAWSAHDGANDIVLTAPITKALQSSGGWAAGNNGNGLFSGARSTDTWYHVYAIQQDATGNVDAGLSTSYPPSDLPAGWSKWRRLGSVYTTNTGNLLGYLQVGRYF